jgi:hypothetical protein
MKVTKQSLFDRAMLLKSSGIPENHPSMIEVAVLAGAYTGCGGKKNIEVPEFLTPISIIVTATVIAKAKFSNSTARNLKILTEAYNTYTGGNIQIFTNNNRVSLLWNGGKTDFNIPNVLNSEVLCVIMEVAIQAGLGGIQIPNEHVRQLRRSLNYVMSVTD